MKKTILFSALLLTFLGFGQNPISITVSGNIDIQGGTGNNNTAIISAVGIQNITAIPSPDENGYNVRMVFFLVNNPNPVTINFFLERIR